VQRTTYSEHTTRYVGEKRMGLARSASSMAHEPRGQRGKCSRGHGNSIGEQMGKIILQFDD
jgi:hypothetical protein